ncbi:glycoside hydrolase family 2 protein [Flavobacterium sp. IMCC34852]|uniref:Glycoside hydrolase family 2 protein n=1 Tax=Flavobacterium rivulicola TaxID=2732161 RepID=A0A7Y3VYY4_9FLAO|nr:beta-galactosidase GalA [Flavobacterium sp. IMCC34852]NNT71926.1 glycoside hydrolase family 2 protein [Flavobacterium sp. IMCC34852]
MKKIQYHYILALFLIVSFSANAQEKISLDEDWKFHFGHAANPEKDFDYSKTALLHKSNVFATTVVNPKFVDTAWASVNVPHDWVVELPFVNSPQVEMDSHGYKPVGGMYPETSIGWYRKHFTVDKSKSSKRFELQFDGIYRNAEIWINGFYVGTNFSGYVGNSYDVTDYINFEGENVLVVRVDATQYEGWFYEGAGIYRHVWLNITDKIFIPVDGIFVHAEVKGKNAIVNIETTVQNNNLQASNGSVYSYITDRNGKVLAKTAEQKITLGVHKNTTVIQKLNLNNTRLWSLDDPYLYRVISVVKSGNQIVHQTKTRFGIKTVRFDAKKGFFLNEKHLKIQGTNNHQDHAGIGSALPDYMQYYRIKLLKEMGSNSYRASHNAPTPELLDACDSIGMLVLDEQRLLNSSPEYVDQFKRLIKRDRNHPSVFLWSIGNEEQNIQGNDYGKRIAQTLLAIQQDLDPSRTSTYAADMPNVYKGVNEVIPIRGFNYREYAVADYHRDHPNQPLLGTEMGSTVTTRGIYEKDEIRAYVPDQDITHPWWASKAETWWKLAAENDFWLGGYVWTGFDYRGEPTPYKWPNISSHFGIMDVCGFPKNIYYYYQSWWTDKDVLHISPHWNWPEKIGKPIEVWVNSNADEVELFLNGKTLGKKVMPRNSHLKWEVIYEPGTLEAIGYKKGKKITSKVETTGTAYKIILTSDKTILTADGKDATVVNISISDDKGREVPIADNMVKFYLSGDAKIIGVGNGDPSSHEPDKCKDGMWQRSAFNGKCQVIIQAGKTNGSIKLEAKANGLQSASTTITLVK